MNLVSRIVETKDIVAAAEYCYEHKWTDGLPVLPPTDDAIERIIEYLGRDPQDVLGIIPPRDGIATIETVAINCVMAGCKPEYVPIVLAALEAMLEERFNLNGVQTTTHGCAPLLMVSGPAVKTLDFNTKECAFGHGCRATATIGRAIRLVLWNIGGGYPGDPCKTIQGHPGYYSFCVAEDAETNPWEPLHVELGYQPADTAAIVTAVEGPHLVSTSAGLNPAEDVLHILADAIATLGGRSNSDTVLVLSPLAAKKLADSGFSKMDVKRELVKLATRSVREMKRHLTGIPESNPAHWTKLVDRNDDDARVPYLRSVESLVILVAGGWGTTGGNSSVCPGWGIHGGHTVSRKVNFSKELA